MLGGALFRATKELFSDRPQQIEQASALRAKGRFLDAHRIEDPGEKFWKIVWGGLTVKISDYLYGISENDARITYISNKLAEAEAVEINPIISIRNLNQVIKTLLLYPPFSEHHESRVTEFLKVDSSYVLKWLQYWACNVYSSILLFRMYIEYKYLPAADLAIIKIDETAKIACESLFGDEREDLLCQLNECREKQMAEHEQCKEIMANIDKDLLPWPCNSSLNWIDPNLLKYERIMKDKLFDDIWPDPADASSNEQMYEGVLQHFPIEEVAKDHDYNQYIKWRKRFFQDGFGDEPFDFGVAK